MRDVILPRLYQDRDAEILVLGCGSSNLSPSLYRDEGYHYITNLDFSKVCIEEQRALNANLEDMDYVEMDAVEIGDVMDEGSFQMIIDKGCLDCVACSSNEGRVPRMIENVEKVLANGG
jgi:2-polyprenyl-3-methyl-5-hydroxy-6-metoxy-1,4-benzoquinol methylase